VLPASLLEVLVCPKSKQPLIFIEEDGGFLLCQASRLRYRIDDGVPVLLVEEATEISGEEVDRLLARATQLGLDVSRH